LLRELLLNFIPPHKQKQRQQQRAVSRPGGSPLLLLLYLNEERVSFVCGAFFLFDPKRREDQKNKGRR